MKIYQKDRTAPVRLFDDLSELDGLNAGTAFSFSVLREEYYVVQLLLTECSGEYEITVSGLDGRATVYNTQGIDKYGRPFRKKYAAEAGRINPVYIGFDFSGMESGACCAAVRFSGAEEQEVLLDFQIREEAVKNHGYDDLWRLSRLNWLNSTRAQDHEVVPPFLPIETDGSTLRLLGRTVELGEDLQLRQVESFFDEGVCLTDTVQLRLLRAPSAFEIKGESFTCDAPSVENHGDSAVLTVRGRARTCAPRRPCTSNARDAWNTLSPSRPNRTSRPPFT